MEAWVARNTQNSSASLKEISKKEVFILDGILEQMDILKKICPGQQPSSPKEAQRSESNQKAKESPGF